MTCVVGAPRASSPLSWRSDGAGMWGNRMYGMKNLEQSIAVFQCSLVSYGRSHRGS